MFLRVLLAAVVGGGASTYVQQYARHEDEADFVPATTPIVVGTLAGLIAPPERRLLVALVSSAVVALVRDDLIDTWAEGSA